MTDARTTPPDDPADAWLVRWLDGVASAKAAMSQRAVSSIDKHGGLDRLVDAARARGIHLLQFTDDKGKALVAASLTPFRTLC